MKIREVFFPACLNIPVSESKRQWGKDPRNLGLNFSASTTWRNCSWPQGRLRRQSQALKWLQNWLLLLRMQGQVKSKANNFKNQAFSSLSIVFSQAVFSLSFKQENAFCLVRKAERLIYSDHAQDTWGVCLLLLLRRWTQMLMGPRGLALANRGHLQKKQG